MTGCDVASKGDIGHVFELLCMYAATYYLRACLRAGQVKRLIENGVDASSSDHDKRAAIHLSAAEGHDQVVDYLLASKASTESYGVATIGRLLEIIGLFCKRAL